MAFWRRLLAGSDWSHLLSLATPAFFDVVSARDLTTRARKLAHNWFAREEYLACVSGLREALSKHDIGIEMAEVKPNRSLVPFRSEPLAADECPMAEDGDAVLRLFFLQIAALDSVFLDLRASRFCHQGSSKRNTFRPLPLFSHWSPDFVQGVRQLYRGFYEDDNALFVQATQALGVSAANDVFERAFGGERKHASRCSLAEFRDTFQEVFVRCRDAKQAFHPDFVTLGIMLATLYDHLETLGGVYDVAAAYHAAQPEF
ncbi:MAG TPA: hypothetical protein VKP30_31675 [Polyangiaceae bacterium]|nr:hypothetical protein [Polyangiaceae bacterium]